VKHIEGIVSDNNIEFLDLKYSDMAGRLRHVTLPVSSLESARDKGVGFDSSSIAGFRSVEEGDMVLKPDPDTAFVDPFAKRPTLSFFASVYDPGTGEVYERDPRAILAKAVGLLRAETGADEVMVRPEYEFYLFNSAEFFTTETAAQYRIVTDELSFDDHTGLSLHKGPAYHVAPPFDRSSDFRSELSSLMMGCGVPVKYHHHEGGRYSQVEVEPSFLPALKAADGVMLSKYLARNLAFGMDKSVTFMPKPIHGEPGSGMHLHMYLDKAGVSVFGDEASETGLSRTACLFIGGILAHAPCLCAFTNPSTNSYRRLTPGFEAPTLVFFSFGNRTAAIRIPGYITSSKEMALEYRIPDGSSNPYLAIAAVLLAGLDGIRNELDPGLPFQGGLKEAQRRYGRRALPRVLGEALKAMKRDSGFLKQGGTFPDGMLDFWYSYKLAESEAVLLRPHPWEFNLYYGC
jgi:glutamine synthetase